MNYPVRVLYLGHTAIAGGAELSLVRLCQNIDLSKITPIVALAEDGPIVEKLRQTGASVHVIPLDESIRKLSKDELNTNAFVKVGRLLTVASYGIKIARFAKREQIDIIHSNSLKAHFYGTIASKISGVPIVWHVRDSITGSYMPGPAVKVVRLVASTLPDRIITVSEPVKSAILNNKKGDFVAVIHDGLTDEEFAVHQRRPRLDDSAQLRFVMLGRLMPWKGQHIFIEAASRVLRDGHNATFTIIGGPLFQQEEYEARLHKMVSDLGIGDKVAFTGHRTDVAELLKKADVVVHASISPDPLPGTIPEGQAAGLAVIGSNSGGVPEMIEHAVTGLLAEPGDPESLAAAMSHLITDRELYHKLASQGYDSVRQNFRITQTIDSISAVYADMLRSQPLAQKRLKTIKGNA